MKTVGLGFVDRQNWGRTFIFGAGQRARVFILEVVGHEVVHVWSDVRTLLRKTLLHLDEGVEDFLQLDLRTVEREDVFLSLIHVYVSNVVHVELGDQRTQFFCPLEHKAYRLLLLLELQLQLLYLFEVDLVSPLLLGRRSGRYALHHLQVFDFLSLQHNDIVFLLDLSL